MKHAAKQVLQSFFDTELSDEEAATLGGIMTPRKLKDEEFLINEGEADDSLYLVLEGKLEVVKRTGAGGTTSLAILREGSLAGELSFVDGEPHTVGLRALCASQVLRLKRKDFEDVIDSHPRLVYNVMRAVALSAHRIVHKMNSDFVELSNYVFKQHGRY